MNHLQQNRGSTGRLGLGPTVFAFLLITLVGCGSNPNKNTPLKTYKVQSTTLHKMLHFTGTVQPIQENTLTSPMDAVVESMPYHYGQHVNKGDEVFTLNSTELQKQYNDTVTEYLKAKDAYTIARAKFTGTEDLWNSGLLSKNNFLSEKSSLNNARVTLMQATRKLSEMLEKMGNKHDLDMSDLSFADFDKVRQALAGKHNLIHIKASNTGVLLYPPKTGDDKTARITVGTAVKSGQVLVLIGDLTGIRLEIDVPEVDIDKIKVGMSATIRGIAFAKTPLTGKLITINAQASANASNALPAFTAIVEVKSLTPKQQEKIKVGMSATIELAADSANKLMIPIASIKQKNGQSTVRVRAANGSITERKIITGAANADNVIVDTGLKVGDVVVYE